MAMTKRTVKSLGLALNKLRPREEGPERDLWKKMVTATAANAVPMGYLAEFRDYVGHSAFATRLDPSKVASR